MKIWHSVSDNNKNIENFVIMFDKKVFVITKNRYGAEYMVALAGNMSSDGEHVIVGNGIYPLANITNDMKIVDNIPELLKNIINKLKEQ